MNIKLFFISIFIITLSACSIEKDEAKIGPENSWWLGGADGGVFIKITDDNKLNDRIYEGVVFFDYDKSVWYRGPFKLVGNISFIATNHDQYLFWDGERIHLQETSYLEVVNPVPPL